METAQLYQGLTFLAYTTGIIIILAGIMLTKVLFDFSKLTQNVNETIDIVKNELTPTLKNVNKSVEILSGIIIKTDAGINKIKDILKKSPLGIISKITSATGTAAKGFISGLFSALKIFNKKN